MLLTVAVIVVGLFAMPSTLSLFSGQHTFNNNGSENEFCWKCHSDVYNELTWNQYAGPAPPHNSGDLVYCKVCHRTGQIPWMGDEYKISEFSPGINPGLNLSGTSGTHAAVTVECIFCHDMAVAEITGSNEAHNNFYNTANQTSLLKGGNEACVGCHTHAGFNGTWVRKGGYIISADITSGSWNMTFSVNQTNVNATSSG